MSKKVEFYLSALRNAGHRITEQREIICDYLAQTDKHPTPYQVYSDIHGQHPEISRATIYNTLNALQQLGAIVEINFGANHTHYETDPSPHVNLICLRCHQVVDYHSMVADAVTTTAAFTTMQKALGFQPLATKVDIIGLCRLCQLTEVAKQAPLSNGQSA
jgi:Fur family transcriptional regulator, peroxide stress response regulator